MYFVVVSCSNWVWCIYSISCALS